MNGLAELIRLEPPAKEYKTEKFKMRLTPTEMEKLSELGFYSGRGMSGFLSYCIEVSHKQMKEQQTKNTGD